MNGLKSGNNSSILSCILLIKHVTGIGKGTRTLGLL